MSDLKNILKKKIKDSFVLKEKLNEEQIQKFIHEALSL
jgi:hypothetical protein